jgi:ligand-binding sensor domain-containing protein
VRGADGSLWIGTAAGLVGHIRGDDLTTSSIGAQIEAMLEDHDGTLWVTTENYLLPFHAATQEQIGTAIALPGPFLSGPLQDKSGSIWFSTDSGVLRLDPRDPQVRFVKIVKGKFWLSEDTGGTIWIANPDGFTRPLREGQALSGNGMATKTFNAHTVLHDSEGKTWIGTLGQGLVRLRADSDDVQKMEKFSERDGLSTEFVWCLLEDREHNIWVGTQNGLNRFRETSIPYATCVKRCVRSVGDK